MRPMIYASALILAATALAAQATDNAPKSEASSTEASRVGTCEDAKSQMAYFCDEGNAKNDSMVQMGTACNNAKSNVKEACEGVVEPDKKYTFDKD